MRKLPGLLGLAVTMILVGATQSPAEHDDADPCADATSQLQLAQCWSDSASEAEDEVKRRSAELEAALAEAGATAALGMLEQERSHWDGYLKAHCSLYGARYEGGSAQAMVEAVCRYRLAEQRASELGALLEEWSR